MAAEPPRNSFRAFVIRGERPPVIVSDKKPRHETEDDATEAALEPAIVSRSESRHADHRGKDRHRLSGEGGTARYQGNAHEVELINLSAGGAMIRAGFEPRLWDMVELQLGDGPAIECAVRWIKGDLVGLEFAHETQIDCDPEERARLLLEVIQRSFPDVEVRLDQPEQPAEDDSPAQKDLGKRAEMRHPLIWKGKIHYAFDTNPVRLRNISAGGVLVDVLTDYPQGAEVLLDLGEAGQFEATVSWIQGDQAGLLFKRPFDLNCLANARPDVAPRHWMKIDFGDGEEDSTPWDEQWTRSSLEEMRSDLESFLKR